MNHEKNEQITIRDQFAMAVLPSLLETAAFTAEKCAAAYEIADAMIRARDTGTMKTSNSDHISVKIREVPESERELFSVIEFTSILDMNDCVSDRLNKGWELHGQMSVIYDTDYRVNRYTQAMVRLNK